ncbi:hypothetical protein DL240_05960 [Lujinxingia litoralis]|uniref:Peptidase M43 pregnancy-associated plasma-A domain-containing protein n=1 Tax=Lujinxingia litoralis TaxID=2211119 RepID=A0A328CCR5_9DELT|nr:hypothetical protein [Lujinxingia litoralis]RAL23701.1 hypothetical protein DL240_05960 [Lujinxingia litoralis]
MRSSSLNLLKLAMVGALLTSALPACVPTSSPSQEPLIVIEEDTGPVDDSGDPTPDTGTPDTGTDTGEDPTLLCTNTCQFANDGECDDGGPGAQYGDCDLGTDCTDCGARAADPEPEPEPDPEPICTNTCQHANDGECDDGGPGASYNVCTYGTDCGDCGEREGLRNCNANADCAEGLLCNATGQCVSSQGGSSIEFVTLTDFQASAQDVWDSSFAVTGDVRSVSLIVELASPDATAYIWTVATPQGTLLYDIERSDQSLMHLSPVTYGGQMGLLMPNSPQYALNPGTYTVRFWAEDPTQVRVHAMIKRGPSSPQGGSLPVTFWFAEQNILSAATAQSDEDFQYALNIMRQIYANIGIALGPIFYRDVGGTLGRQLAAPQDDEVLCRGMRQVATAGNLPGINLLMFDDAPGMTILGLSCGLPGAPSRPGVVRSGATAALAYLRSDPDVFAETIAHEAGHYLGLFHTTERTGTDHDPLDDTPECPLSRDTNGDRLVSADECVNDGATNTMFWTSFGWGEQHQRTLTPHQRFVLMNNAMVETY